MHFTAVLASLAAMVAMTTATSVSYDTGYDDPNRSMTAVACSDGAFGLMPRYGWQTQGQIKHFPYIGGADTVNGWGSSNCGKCYSLTYKGKTIYILAIDHASTGFNIAKAAMNDLTNNQAVALGRIEATTAEVALSKCGL